MTSSLAALSASVARLVAAAAPSLTSIRIGIDSHVTGLLCEDDTVITTDHALPVQAHYTVALSTGALVAALPGPRDPIFNVAALQLETPVPVAPPSYGTAVLGGIVIVLAASIDATPSVRLSVIHRCIRNPDGAIPVLDLPAGSIDQGAAVLDPDGRLIGLLDIGANGEAIVVVGAAISRTLPPLNAIARSAVPLPPEASTPRGWLGVALQPITVPDTIAARTGQRSGRMVVRVTSGGPAERAGLRVGDVLLALNGTSASGSHALRAFLGADRIGSTVEVKLLRDGTLLTARLVVVRQPTATAD
jgi:S1-C subfamily serine protease